MLRQAGKPPAMPQLWLWLTITLLWGTVFFGTSIIALNAAVFINKKGFFNPAWEEIYKVYLPYAAFLVLFALVVRSLKRLLDPEGRRQSLRQQDVLAGKRERVFVSLGGSIASSFFFTLATSAAFLLVPYFTYFIIDLPLQVILFGALLNIGAGLLVSVVVGLVILLLRSL